MTEPAVEKLVTREPFRTDDSARPAPDGSGERPPTSPGRGQPSPAAARPDGPRRQALSRADSGSSTGRGCPRRQDFADMERRPGGGGGGAVVWLLGVVTASALVEVIAGAISYARGGW